MSRALPVRSDLPEEIKRMADKEHRTLLEQIEHSVQNSKEEAWFCFSPPTVIMSC